MAQKWYQKASVQSAFVAGIFLIIGALITTWPQLKNNKTKQNIIATDPQKNMMPSPPKQQESNKIYQDDKEAGKITGKIKINKDGLFLEMLIEACDFDKNLPFEYQEVKYILCKIEKAQPFYL